MSNITDIGPRWMDPEWRSTLHIDGYRFLFGFVAIILIGLLALDLMEGEFYTLSRPFAFLKELLLPTNRGRDFHTVGDAWKLLRNEERAAGGIPVARPMAGFRLRKRGRFVSALRAALGLNDPTVTVSDVLAGRWTPDLVDNSVTAQGAWVLAELVAAQAMVLGGGLTKTRNRRAPAAVPQGTPVPLGARILKPWLRVLVSGNEVTISMEAVAAVSRYVTFRERTPDLLLAAKARALDWFKDNGFKEIDVALLLPGSVAVGMMLSVPEVEANSLLASNLPALLLRPSSRFVDAISRIYYAVCQINLILKCSPIIVEQMRVWYEILKVLVTS